ncbi:porin family protein [Polaribacter sp. 20A6]|uniref:porin family protein n=1 Tax=Polaribacter sp. 20A6 TaxID=2687289 RepID=UPI0013FD81E7|nr:porin family protein [Polaribacter sp. 20A6]
MKKLLVIAALAFAGLGSVKAQEVSYGVTAGFHQLSLKVSVVEDFTLSTDASGFYVGFFGEFKIDEKFNIQPEIHFASTYKDGDSSNQLIVPVMAKYYVSEEFNVQAGPQFDYILDSDTTGVNKFGLGLGFGAGYDFSDKVFASARYSVGLTNRLEDAPSGNSIKFSTFQIGIGYRL